MNNKYEAVIGLEVHAQLLTKTKAFCACSTVYGASPNTNTCPICLGHPGTLPYLNKSLVEYIVKLGIATNCKIRQYSTFARKNYFYPDLVKGYQITQHKDPICYDGFLEIELEDKHKKIGITRIHMEEDTGKAIHDLDIDTLLDFNRSGIPLVEIVSEPDIRNAGEAFKYLTELKRILVYLGICTGNMEEGALRCDANVSVRLIGADKFGTKTEVKNMNSFRNVEKAIEYEIARQIEVIENNGQVQQETRMWDGQKQVTKTMRTKSNTENYRYFTEPDMVPVVVSQAWQEEIKSSLVELPMARKNRFCEQYSIPNYDAGVLVEDQSIANYYEAVCATLKSKTSKNYKLVSNWLMTEVLRLLSERNIGIEELNLNPELLGELVELFSEEIISSKIAKDIFPEVLEKSISPREIIDRDGLAQLSDVSEIEQIVKKIIEENPQAVEKYNLGKTNTLGFIVGMVLKASNGKANPKIVTDLVKKHIES